MVQSGRILRIEDRRVWVIVNENLRPGELIPVCCSDTSQTIEARNPSRLPLQAGDMVELVSDSGWLLRVAGLAAGLPLAGFFACLALAAVLLPAWGQAGQALAALAGLGLGILPFLAWRRRNPVFSYPTVRLP